MPAVGSGALVGSLVPCGRVGHGGVLAARGGRVMEEGMRVRVREDELLRRVLDYQVHHACVRPAVLALLPFPRPQTRQQAALAPLDAQGAFKRQGGSGRGAGNLGEQEHVLQREHVDELRKLPIQACLLSTRTCQHHPPEPGRKTGAQAATAAAAAPLLLLLLHTRDGHTMRQPAP